MGEFRGTVVLGDRLIVPVFEDVDPSDGYGSGQPIRKTLLSSDGTPGGTFDLLPADVQMYSWYPGSEADGLRFFTACRVELAFPATCINLPTALWRTDGTPAGTVRLTEYGVVPPQGGSGELLAERGLFLFRGKAPEERFDFELWVSDGTAAGTRQLAVLNENGPGDPFTLAELGSEVYYTYRIDGPEGTHSSLGRSDGTAAGTGPRPGAPSDAGSLGSIVPGDDELFLFYRREDGVHSLWREAGGPDGPTLLVEDLGFAPSLGLRILESGGETFYFAGEQRGSVPPATYRLWMSDGTPGGTHPIPRQEGTVPSGAITSVAAEVIDGRVYFPLNDGVHGVEPWVSDGTEEGTRLIADLCPGPCNWGSLLNAIVITDLGDRPLFNARRAEGADRELLVYDPETGELTSWTEPCPGDCEVVGETARAGGSTYFRVESDGAPSRVWATDGTESGTFPVAELEAGGELGAGETPFRRFYPGTDRVDLGPFVVAGEHLFFAAQDAEHGWELWTAPVSGEGSDFPVRPPAEGLVSPELPGFAVWVRISAGSLTPILGSSEPECIPETLCVSGAVPGRSEVFVRVVGPRPNGFLWPTLVKFTTSTVEVWIEQLSTGIVRYYELEGSAPGTSELPGLFDRTGFPPG